MKSSKIEIQNKEQERHNNSNKRCQNYSGRCSSLTGRSQQPVGPQLEGLANFGKINGPNYQEPVGWAMKFREEAFVGAAGRWYWSADQLYRTPSILAGITFEKELSYRQQAANFIQDMGQKLKV